MMTSQAESSITLKAAQPEDASQIAPLMIIAGRGFYEFLFEGLELGCSLEQMITRLVSADKGPYGFQNHMIAERCGHLAGFVNAFPARLIRDQGRGPIPPERWDHIAPLNEVMDWESFFLSGIAVLPDDRGHGVAQALLESVFTKARQLGFQNVTLHVLEGNDRALRLYERSGFAVARTAVLAPHPMLPGTRSLLMRRELAGG